MCSVLQCTYALTQCEYQFFFNVLSTGVCLTCKLPRSFFKSSIACLMFILSCFAYCTLLLSRITNKIIVIVTSNSCHNMPRYSGAGILSSSVFPAVSPGSHHLKQQWYTWQPSKNTSPICLTNEWEHHQQQVRLFIVWCRQNVIISARFCKCKIPSFYRMTSQNCYGRLKNVIFGHWFSHNVTHALYSV